MEFILYLVVALLLSNALIAFARHIHLPSVVALLLITFVLSIPSINHFVANDYSKSFSFLADMGILALMFQAGINMSKKNIIKEMGEASIVALLGFMVPLIIGMLAFLLLGYGLEVAVVVGLALSISAEGTTTKFLMDVNKLNTRLGALLVDAGILDDTLGIIGLVLISGFYAQSEKHEIFLLVLTIAFFILGLILRHDFNQKALKHTNIFLESLLIPFFFIGLGMHFELNLDTNLGLLVIILVLALSTKILGTYLTKFWVKMESIQYYLVGWGMNSRGGVGLVVATIALRLNLIPVNIYSALIVMAFITTMLFPFVMSMMLHKHPDIMD